MTFRAVRADKTDAGHIVKLVDMDDAELMDGDVTIRVTHSTVNYKDGLALSGKSPVIRRFPMVLGVDLAGIVESSRRSDFAHGDEVVLTGYGLSETHFGGYAERARVNGDWLVKLPTGLTRAEAMAIGTAGFTAMLALMAIERHDIAPSSGPALVTGAAGGVGSMAISLFADNVSSGIEPVFSYRYTRSMLMPDGSRREEEVSDYAYRLFRRLKGETAPLPEYFVDAQSLSPADHLIMQAAVQRHIDSSISKTMSSLICSLSAFWSRRYSAYRSR